MRLSVGLLVHPPVRLSISHYMRLSLRLYVCLFERLFMRIYVSLCVSILCVRISFCKSALMYICLCASNCD